MSTSVRVTAFELPNICRLVGTGKYFAVRIAAGFELRPTDPASQLLAYCIERIEADDSRDCLQPTRHRRRS